MSIVVRPVTEHVEVRAVVIEVEARELAYEWLHPEPLAWSTECAVHHVRVQAIGCVYGGHGCQVVQVGRAARQVDRGEWRADREGSVRCRLAEAAGERNVHVRTHRPFEAEQLCSAEVWPNLQPEQQLSGRCTPRATDRGVQVIAI